MPITYDQLAEGAGLSRVTVNENFAAALPAMAGGKRNSTSVGLTLELIGGVFDVAGTPTVVGNASFTLAASDTTYIYRDSSGVLQDTLTAPTGWPGPITEGVAICDATTDTETITTFNDWRIAGGGGLAAILSALGISAWSYDGTNISITMASDGKQLLLGPFA